MDKVMQVLNDNVLVKVDGRTGPSQTASGLYIPETSEAQGQILKGTVVQYGPGRLLDNGTRAPMNVESGFVVFFPKFNASKIDHNGETFYVFPETQILAIL
jgi:chaperonin GroES